MKKKLIISLAILLTSPLILSSCDKKGDKTETQEETMYEKILDKIYNTNYVFSFVQSITFFDESEPSVYHKRIIKNNDDLAAIDQDNIKDSEYYHLDEIGDVNYVSMPNVNNNFWVKLDIGVFEYLEVLNEIFSLERINQVFSKDGLYDVETIDENSYKLKREDKEDKYKEEFTIKIKDEFIDELTLNATLEEGTPYQMSVIQNVKNLYTEETISIPDTPVNALTDALDYNYMYVISSGSFTVNATKSVNSGQEKTETFEIMLEEKDIVVRNKDVPSTYYILRSDEEYGYEYYRLTIEDGKRREEEVIYREIMDAIEPVLTYMGTIGTYARYYVFQLKSFTKIENGFNVVTEVEDLGEGNLNYTFDEREILTNISGTITEVTQEGTNNISLNYQIDKIGESKFEIK